MYKRNISEKLLALSKKFPVCLLTGPRQSGKTTLAQFIFPSKPYVSLEKPDVRHRAQMDPNGFLGQFPQGAILDEIQKAPELLSYIQEIVDRHDKPGQFILTGSQNLLLMENVTQTLAGRVGILTLLPLSLSELKSSRADKPIEQIIWKGFFPRLHKTKIHPQDFYPSYVSTYVERDVRQILNVGDLATFQKFLKIAASQSGQLINLTSLGNDCGINYKTVDSWLSVLETSYVTFRLTPHHANFKKRVIKMPKLYFYDTGLLCYLLEITDPKQLIHHPLWGSIFETFVVSELFKIRFNHGLKSNFYFWRDKTGHEVDVVIDRGASLMAVEIKATQTFSAPLLKNLQYWEEISNQQKVKDFLVYGGKESFQFHKSEILTVRDLEKLPVA